MVHSSVDHAMQAAPELFYCLATTAACAAYHRWRFQRWHIGATPLLACFMAVIAAGFGWLVDAGQGPFILSMALSIGAAALSSLPARNRKQMDDDWNRFLRSTDWSVATGSILERENSITLLTAALSGLWEVDFRFAKQLTGLQDPRSMREMLAEPSLAYSLSPDAWQRARFLVELRSTLKGKMTLDEERAWMRLTKIDGKSPLQLIASGRHAQFEHIIRAATVAEPSKRN